ncbi:MAG: hypothetical protein ACXAAT_13965 [Candidatus Hodarchaeales archaeon]|jgi:hypothetical protein
MKWTDTEAPKAAMATLNRVSGVTLWEEMIRDRRDFCLNKCQNNKVVNMLRPKCTDRRYLDVLLLKRESKKKMPMFCYSQRIKSLLRAFQEGEDLLPDVYVYLDDYWKIIHEKQGKPLRTASDFLKRTLIKGKEVLPMGNIDQLIETHFLRDQIFCLWPKLDLCLVNAQETSIHSIRMLRSIVDELRFENLKLQESEIVESKLEKSPAFTGFSDTEIWAEIHLPSEIEEDGIDFKVKDLHLIFKTIVDVTELENEHLNPEDSSESVLTSTDVSLEKSKKAKVLK